MRLIFAILFAIFAQPLVLMLSLSAASIGSSLWESVSRDYTNDIVIILLLEILVVVGVIAIMKVKITQ